MAKSKATKRSKGALFNKTADDMRSDFFSLKSDGESSLMVFVGEPFTRKEKNVNGQDQVRAYFPIATPHGLQAWGVGKKVFKTIDELWPDSIEVVFLVTRHGGKGDSSTTYTIEPQAGEAPADNGIISIVTDKELGALQRKIITSVEPAETDADC